MCNHAVVTRQPHGGHVVPVPLSTADGGTTQGPSWGYLKVIFSETLSIFGDTFPQNGSKNEPGMPPQRASRGLWFLAAHTPTKQVSYCWVLGGCSFFMSEVPLYPLAVDDQVLGSLKHATRRFFRCATESVNNSPAAPTDKVSRQRRDVCGRFAQRKDSGQLSRCSTLWVLSLCRVSFCTKTPCLRST